MQKVFFLSWILLMLVNILIAAPKDDKKRGDEEIVPVYNEGIVYSLPRVGIAIEVKAVGRTHIPGPYASFAKKYLGLDNVISKQATSWHIEDVSLSTFSEPDPNAVFESNSSQPIWISLAPNGVISGVNIESRNSSALIVPSKFIKNENQPIDVLTDLSSHEFYDIILDSLTGSEKMVGKSLEQKAREAADFLIKLRKRKLYEIVDSYDELPPDGDAYKVMVKEIDQIERRYSELFVGRTINHCEKASFLYMPEGKKSDIVFRFSEEKGILPKSDISGKPIMIQIESADKQKSKLNGFKDAENPETGKANVFYRVPVTSTVSIANGIDILSQNQVLLPQMGALLPVPASLLDGTYSIQFNEDTGVMEKFVRNENINLLDYNQNND